MAIVSKSKAAKLAGVSRPTMYRYIKNGKVSVTKNKDGSEGVDTSELMRVFGELKDDSVKSDTSASRNALPRVTVNIELLEYKIEQLEKQLKASEAREQDIKTQNAKLLGLVETQTLAIEHIKAPSIFDRLFKRK